MEKISLRKMKCLQLANCLTLILILFFYPESSELEPNNKSMPGADSLQAVADYLGTTPQYLLRLAKED